MNNKKETVFRKLKDNDGIGTIEVVLILIVICTRGNECV